MNTLTPSTKAATLQPQLSDHEFGSTIVNADVTNKTITGDTFDLFGILYRKKNSHAQPRNFILCFGWCSVVCFCFHK